MKLAIIHCENKNLSKIYLQKPHLKIIQLTITTTEYVISNEKFSSLITDFHR